MTPTLESRDWTITRAKVDEALRRIIEHANPLQIIAFGSRARGDHHVDSDLDLAVILEVADETQVRALVPYSLLQGLRLTFDMIVASKTRYDLHRPWINSVFNYIDQEGVILYDREHPQRARPEALHVSGGGPARSQLRAA